MGEGRFEQPDGSPEGSQRPRRPNGPETHGSGRSGRPAEAMLLIKEVAGDVVAAMSSWRCRRGSPAALVLTREKYCRRQPCFLADDRRKAACSCTCFPASCCCKSDSGVDMMRIELSNDS